MEVRGRLVHLQSAFEDCQLGALHSSPRNDLLIVQLFAITFNNRPLSHDRKVIITRDVCSGQPPLSLDVRVPCVHYCGFVVKTVVTELTARDCPVGLGAWPHAQCTRRYCWAHGRLRSTRGAIVLETTCSATCSDLW